MLQKLPQKTWHSTFLLLRAVDLTHTICLILHPVLLSYSDQSNWDDSEMINKNLFPPNENRITVHPRVLVKTTPEVWRIIEHTVVSLRSSMSACCQAIGVGTSTFTGLHKTPKCPSNCSTFLWWKSKVCSTLCYNLATKHWEHAVHAVWRAVMDMFALFSGAAERQLVWKSAWMQLQGQTHAGFGFQGFA